MAVYTSKLQSIALPRAQGRAVRKHGAIILFVIFRDRVFVRGDLCLLTLFRPRYKRVRQRLAHNIFIFQLKRLRGS